MKKYIPKPGQPTPTPTPAPGGDKPPRYKTQPVKPEPTPKPKPKPGKDDGRKTIMPVKPKPKKAGGVKRRDVSDEQLVPRRVKPTPNRRRFLEQLNEMNKKSR